MNWINVNTQMPKVNQSVLAVRGNRKVCNLYFNGQNWKDDGFDSTGKKTFTDVTHWCTLPEPPHPNN